MDFKKRIKIKRRGAKAQREDWIEKKNIFGEEYFEERKTAGCWRTK